MLKNCRFKHTCNDDSDVGCRKQPKLAYHVLTCKFPIWSLQCHDLLTLWCTLYRYMSQLSRMTHFTTKATLKPLHF